MKIVIDTNIIASAIFFGGKPRDLVEMLMKKELNTYVNQRIIEEYSETVEYLKNKYPEKSVSIPLAQIVSACEVIDEISDIKVCRDPDDDKFINCAVDSKALYIVSGDKDLLVLEQYEDVEIVTIGEFLEKYRNGN